MHAQRLGGARAAGSFHAKGHAVGRGKERGAEGGVSRASKRKGGCRRRKKKKNNGDRLSTFPCVVWTRSKNARRARDASSVFNL